MPKGPQGQKRPADVIGAAVMAAKIATGEITEAVEAKAKSAAAEMGRKAVRRARPAYRKNAGLK